MNGALVIDKPAGITSHDAVSIARRLTRERRIGHIGTLDPFATGVLVLLLGKATRLARFFDHATKSYEAVMRVGFATDSYDLTGKPLGPDRAAEFQPELVEGLLRQFEGTGLQRPPAYSAKKVEGVPAYKKARKGQGVELAPVEITISNMALLETKNQLVKFSVTVSSGTYIRSLAHDLGERLGVGAHLTELRRVAVGNFRVQQARTLDQLQADLNSGAPAETLLIPMERLLPEFPEQRLTEEELSGVLHGRTINSEVRVQWLRLLTPDGRLAALALSQARGAFHPQVVLLDALDPASGGQLGAAIGQTDSYEVDDCRRR